MNSGEGFQQLLHREAKAFLCTLKRAGVEGEVVKNSFRDYSVKVRLFQGNKIWGEFPIYYSPRRSSFTPYFGELLEKGAIPTLEKAWRDRYSTGSEWVAYVDGSYCAGKVGFGALILWKNTVRKKMYGLVPSGWSASRQVGGELYAVCRVLDWCEHYGVKKITICYDYKGIEEWATGRWRTNIPLTRRYASFVQRSTVKVCWKKVRGHSGDKWNELADCLARRGALGKERKETLTDPQTRYS